MKGFVAIVVGLLLCCSLSGMAQAPVRKLPQIINRPNVNLTSPFISLDGNTLIYTSDYAEDNEPTIFFSVRTGAIWSEPRALPKHINNKSNFPGGYSLSADGKTVYITSQRSGGVGGFDIWAGDLKGNSWGDLQNLYIPINSKGHEGSPTFTPDGQTMYFMRCEIMNLQKAEKCKIMVSKKAPNGRWQEPTELPENINTGNAQTPRISADGEILIFASNTMGTTLGQLDLYVSKFQNGVWTDPAPLTFVNTDKNDQFVSFIANGRYLLKDAPGKSKSELTEFLMPEEWRPRPVTKIEGRVTDISGLPTPAYVSVMDLTHHNRYFSGRPDKDGNFFLYLVEGDQYELSIDPDDDHYTFFSKYFDLREANNPLVLTVSAVLKPVQAGDEIALDGIQFLPNSAVLDDANFEIRRLSRLIKASPELRFELHVLLAGYEEASERSNNDLTEVKTDSVVHKIQFYNAEGQPSERDSVVVNTVYHNNRTEKQAQAILEALATFGVDRNVISCVVNARPATPVEEKRTSIAVIARKKE